LFLIYNEFRLPTMTIANTGLLSGNEHIKTNKHYTCNYAIYPLHFAAFVSCKWYMQGTHTWYSACGFQGFSSVCGS